MARVVLKNIHKHYEDVHAVRGVDLDIAEGEFAVLVGPSGCGKSTLLRAIAGLEEIDSGTIQINGDDVSDWSPRDRNVAMVFQNYALYPYMNVYENIAFGLKARRVVKSEIERRVGGAAEMLDITGQLHRYPRHLSGGQRQRVAIGRAIVRDANVFLFDEPLSNLDAKLREEMRVEIKQLHQEIGKTMIYVTHDQIEAMTLADRIVLLRDGIIEQEGPPLTLFEQPRTRFVAGFLGSPSMNFLPGKLRLNGNAAAVVLEDGTALELPQNRIPQGGTRDVVFGVRAEHISRDRGENRRAGAQPIQVAIDIVQPTGTRTYVTFKLAGQPVMAELEAHDVERPSEELPLLVDMNRIVLIDPDTELVI
jgi:multiple sugar transport system ATP-binding protein